MVHVAGYQHERAALRNELSLYVKEKWVQIPVFVVALDVTVTVLKGCGIHEIAQRSARAIKLQLRSLRSPASRRCAK